MEAQPFEPAQAPGSQGWADVHDMVTQLNTWRQETLPRLRMVVAATGTATPEQAQALSRPEIMALLTKYLEERVLELPDESFLTDDGVLIVEPLRTFDDGRLTDLQSALTKWEDWLADHPESLPGDKPPPRYGYLVPEKAAEIAKVMRAHYFVEHVAATDAVASRDADVMDLYALASGKAASAKDVLAEGLKVMLRKSPDAPLFTAITISGVDAEGHQLRVALSLAPGAMPLRGKEAKELRKVFGKECRKVLVAFKLGDEVGERVLDCNTNPGAVNTLADHFSRRFTEVTGVMVFGYPEYQDLAQQAATTQSSCSSCAITGANF